ncbi:hypothetical protein [Streptomyces sp. 061-3]|uniref:hypothetical protein n=1 Tax=Streptomyces sp. 061-3 TaxID=2789268 RepID=UPI003980A727
MAHQKDRPRSVVLSTPGVTSFVQRPVDCLLGARAVQPAFLAPLDQVTGMETCCAQALIRARSGADQPLVMIEPSRLI